MPPIVDGENVNAVNGNRAWLDAEDDDYTEGKLGLQNAEPASGPSIPVANGIQRLLNAISNYLGIATNAVYNALPSWVSTDAGSPSDNVTERAEALTAKFNLSTGHAHSGAAGDGKPISGPDLVDVPLRGYFKQATQLTGITGGSVDVSSAFTLATPSSNQTTKGVVVNAGENKAIIRQASGAEEDDVFTDGLGNEVYGRLTWAASVWTLTFYVRVGGTETPYSFGSASDIRWYYQELYNPLDGAPVYSELAKIPSENVTADTVDASPTQRGSVNTGAQSFAGVKTFSDTTQSTDKDSGAVVTEGGLGVEKNINAGGNIAAVGTMSGSNLSGTNTGDVSLTAVGASPNANAASLSGQALTLQPADATNPGVLTASAQSIGGVKTFANTTQSTDKDSGAIVTEGGIGAEKNINAGGNIAAVGTVTGSNLSGTNTGDVSLAAIGSTPNANGASLSGQALTLQPASGSFGGVLTTLAQSIAGIKTFIAGIVTQAFFATERADVASAATITALSSSKSFVKLTGSTVTEIQGITAGVNGQRIVIHNGTTVDVTLSNEDAGATAANRLVLADAADLTLSAGSSAELVYDTGQSRWVMASGAGTGGGGGGGDTEQTLAGSVSLGSGINSKAVTFQTAMPSNSYEVVAQMKNLIDGSPNIEAILTSAQTSSGFTGKWPTNTPTANYILSFIARHRGQVPLYASDLLVWLDPSDLYTVVEGGGGVSLFRDKSNSNYLFTPFSTGPDMALDYFGAGKHAMQYTAASSHNLKCDVTLPTYITVFMVIDTAGGDSYLMNHNNGASYISTANPGFQIYGGDARWGVTRTGEIQTQGGGITLSGGAKIVTFVYGATEQALYLGNTLTTGALSGSVVSNSNLLADLTLMSASFEDRFLSGHLGEVRIYNRQLSAAEHLAVRQQLSEKWGVAL